MKLGLEVFTPTGHAFSIRFSAKDENTTMQITTLYIYAGAKRSNFWMKHRTDTTPLRFCFASTQPSWWCHIPSIFTNRTHRTRPRFWGPNSHTCLSSGLEVQITQTIHIRLAHTRPSRYRCMSSICLLDSTDTVFIHPYTLALQCTMWIIRDSIRTPQSLSPSLLTFVIHHPWSIGTNLSLDLHRIRRPPRRILRLDTTSQETSDAHNIVNRSSSRIDHHWSSLNRLTPITKLIR